LHYEILFITLLYNLKLFMEKETKLNVKDAILLHLEQIERPLSWLSDKTEIPYPTLYSVLKQRTFSLSEKNLEKINKVLETDFIND
jgi:predicted transcriptional regulator